MLFRGSYLNRKAQQECMLRRPGDTFDMVSGQVLNPHYLHGKRRIMGLGERLEQLATKLGVVKHMDDAFYQDTRAPFTAADIASVTLATTDKALYPIANFPTLGSNYFKFIGKKLAISLFGRITTAATPGNGTWDIYWGTGADANGTIVQSSAAVALTANQTNLSWKVDLLCTARAFGSAGALLVTGVAVYNESVLAAKQFIPASAAAQTTVDLTAANIISVQFKRSGSTAETMQVHDGVVTALN